MSRIDELLQSEGERWRADVDARSAARSAARRARRDRPRITVRHTVIAAAAVLGVATIGVAVHSSGSESARSSAGSNAQNAFAGAAAAPSCVPGSLTRAGPLGSVRPGEAFSIQGERYFTGTCNDTVDPSSKAASRDVVARVVLRLTTSDHRTVTVSTARPLGSAGSFTVRVVVPADAAAGPATITDGRGHRLRLVVAAR